MTTNTLDIIEGRPNGRVLCYEPATGHTTTVIKRFYCPNGVCVAHDGRAMFVASTSACRIFRHWLQGPRRGTTEIFIDELPGLPDNINRASDGNYWLALVASHTDLRSRLAQGSLRRRMVKQVPTDEWLAPGLNNGCVLKFDGAGNVLNWSWDPTGISHSTVTSMREHKGYLYLGGLENQSDWPHSSCPTPIRPGRVSGLLGQQAADLIQWAFSPSCGVTLEQILFPIAIRTPFHPWTAPSARTIGSTKRRRSVS